MIVFGAVPALCPPFFSSDVYPSRDDSTYEVIPRRESDGRWSVLVPVRVDSPLSQRIYLTLQDYSTGTRARPESLRPLPLATFTAGGGKMTREEERTDPHCVGAFLSAVYATRARVLRPPCEDISCVSWHCCRLTGDHSGYSSERTLFHSVHRSGHRENGNLWTRYGEIHLKKKILGHCR